ncbi:MAG: hypothetical protein H7A45_12960 [Verrucomicrobiales bacterium]|nr:hypothetical protein [Verrucomicrobiales bacterium]
MRKPGEAAAGDGVGNRTEPQRIAGPGPSAAAAGDGRIPALSEFKAAGEWSVEATSPAPPKVLPAAE